ncbi:hypothetical protein BDV95DRAFT_171828 [Massariosphaeria phaeospora]|uniref:BTB domain-containing protein n=1 Tax=Massariosphaeria phaeospora TaxID=100035 RepID=A0A7C8I430_9PLEO|nr:hypothetical protein BDV95DRAFT_171828 [Massariosphaeria phaeospora]
MERHMFGDLIHMGTSAIAVRVGAEPDIKGFTVHEQLIRKSSPFFEAALSNPATTAHPILIKLPKCSPTDFHVYVQWLYTGRVHVVLTSPITSDKDTDEYCLLIRGYLLGEYLQDTHYRDTLMDALVQLVSGPIKSFLARTEFGRIYQETKIESPLRRLLVDVAVWRHNWEYAKEQDFPKEMFWGVMTGLADRCQRPAGEAQSTSPFEVVKGTCHYHCHGDDTPCYKPKPPV